MVMRQKFWLFVLKDTNDLHQAGITHILKSSPASQNSCLFTHISTLHQVATKYNKQQSLKQKSNQLILDIAMNLNTANGDFIWMSYRGSQMFTGSLPEDSRSNSSHIARLGNN